MTKTAVTQRESLWRPLKPGNVGYWLSKARPGEKLIYHIGNLMADRATLITEYRRGSAVVRTVNLEPLNTVATEVWRAYERGLVILSQKKLAPNLFQYEARLSQREAQRRAA